jgi:hypothetical protein
MSGRRGSDRFSLFDAVPALTYLSVVERQAGGFRTTTCVSWVVKRKCPALKIEVFQETAGSSPPDVFSGVLMRPKIPCLL